MKTCRNGLHEMTPENSLRAWHARGHWYTRCRACRNHVEALRKAYDRGPRKPNRPVRDTADDFVFLFETGLSPRAIAAKLDMNYPSMLKALNRAGVPLRWDRVTGTWRMGS